MLPGIFPISSQHDPRLACCSSEMYPQSCAKSKDESVSLSILTSDFCLQITLYSESTSSSEKATR
jgi:hypothetical protein